MFEPTEIERLTAEELLLLQRNFEALLRRHAGLIHHVCVRRSKGDAELCKLLQHEVSVGLWLHLDSYRRALPESVWIRWKVRTILYAYRRHRLPPPEQLAFDEADSLAEEACHARESLEELTAYLSPDERALIQQRLEGYSTAEIAERQGTTDSAIYKRMAKVMEKLRIINEKINKQ